MRQQSIFESADLRTTAPFSSASAIPWSNNFQSTAALNPRDHLLPFFAPLHPASAITISASTTLRAIAPMFDKVL